MRLVAMAVTFLLLTALPEAVGEIASVPRPAYSLGDFWLYRLNSTEAGFFTLNGTMNVTVGAFSGFPANGTPVVEMLFEGEGTLGWGEGLPGTEPIDGDWRIQGYELWETSGYKVLRRYLRVTGTGRGQTSGQVFSFESVNTTTNALLLDTWTFPLDATKTGEVSADSVSASWTNLTFPPLPPQNLQENATYRAHTDLAAVGTRELTVPAGSWEAFVINESTPVGWTWHYYVPALAADMRTEAFNATGGVVSRLDLLTYAHADGTPPRPDAFPWWLVASAGIAAGLAVALVASRRRRPPRWTAYEAELPGSPGGAP